MALLLGDDVLFEHQQVPRQHTKVLLPTIDALLSKGGVTLADLDAIAFGAGPGSFTGLRITAGVAQGLALGADKPVLAVSTLATLAEQAYQRWGVEQVFAGLDARMGELYWAAYGRQGDGWNSISAEQVAAPALVQQPDDLTGDWVGIGSAWQYREQLPPAIQQRVTQVDTAAEPQASAMLKLAERQLAQGMVLRAEQVQPVYLRDNVAWQKSNHRDNA